MDANIQNTDTRGTASHFADWVFNKTNPNYCPVEYASTIANRIALGKCVHQEIENIKWWIKKVDAAKAISSNWEIEYSDPHDGTTSQIFDAARLIVDGKPMRCKPDIVFRDIDTDSIIIVERKVTHWRDEDIPKDAWPNIRVQLWCYGWIDKWADAKNIILLCRFYKRCFDREGRQDEERPFRGVYDSRPGWLRDDSNFQKECSQYFSDYGGKFLV